MRLRPVWSQTYKETHIRIAFDNFEIFCWYFPLFVFLNKFFFLSYFLLLFFSFSNPDDIKTTIGKQVITRQLCMLWYLSCPGILIVVLKWFFCVGKLIISVRWVEPPSPHYFFKDVFANHLFYKKLQIFWTKSS